ncbi:MAG: thermonuclease family protein [Candidatus Levybacteria bacterium]|nr:thermonuclease family protein [Candidatus Levybacteria bacterium]
MRKKLNLLSFVIGVLLLLYAFGLGITSNKTTQNKPQALGSKIVVTEKPTKTVGEIGEVKVVKVIDGDTNNVQLACKKETVRLIGIDSPETVNPRKPVQCFGKQASDKAKEVLSGKTITLESDPTQGERDKYKRLLRYVFLQDGTNFNQLMIAEGFAHEYTYRTSYKYQKEFKGTQKKAQESKKGLWADNACVNSSTSTLIQTPTKPLQVQSKPTETLVDNKQFSCDCAKACTQISSCEEAYFQLNNCGCTKRDADGDGIPCESLCN